MVSLREMKSLDRSARKAAQERKGLSDERSRLDRDETSIKKLSGSVRPLTRDDMLRARLRQSLQALNDNKADVDAGLWDNRAEQEKIQKEAETHIEQSEAILEKTRETRFQKLDRSALDGIEREQKRRIDRARDVLNILNRQESDFADMIKMTQSYYYFAEKIANHEYDGNDTINFTGHTLRHVMEVRGKMRDMLVAMRPIGFSKEDFFADSTMDAAAAFHDTGMDANLTPNFFKNFKYAIDSTGALIAKGAESEPRDKHAFTGALHILEDKRREKLEAMGVDVDQAAFLISLHSKRGWLEDKQIRDLSRLDFADIKTAARNFKEECDRRSGIHCDMSWLCKDENWEDEKSWNKEALRKTAISASILRLADANRDGVNLYAQKGADYVISNKESCRGRAAILDENEMYKEIEGMSIAYDNGNRLEELRPGARMDQDEFNQSRAIIFGESNVDFMDTGTTKDGKLVYRFLVNEPDIGIGCTAHAIQERINEIRYSIFANLKAFGGIASDLVIEVRSDNGPVKGIVDCLNFPESWHLVYEE